MSGVDGLLLVDKPGGPTSHDVVARVRRILGERRVGHAGTLDPLATGLLPLVLGRATRLVRFLPGAPKSYVGRLRLGLVTDTDDVTGRVVSRHPGPLPAPAAVIAGARTRTGRSLQVPPVYSAKSVDGVRLHRVARRGGDVTPRPAPVEVFRFDLRDTDDPAVFTFEAVVSSGTYVRSLARDLGADLGCGAVVEALRRTAIGPMTVESAVALALGERPSRAALLEAVLPLESMPLDAPATEVDADEARRFAAGLPCAARETLPEAGSVRVLGPGGRLLGVAEREGALLRPRVVLAAR